MCTYGRTEIHSKLYLRTIPEFLFMSVILSGTSNNIGLPTHITHKNYIVNER